MKQDKNVKDLIYYRNKAILILTKQIKVNKQ